MLSKRLLATALTLSLSSLVLADPLAPCTINMDASCPNAVGGVCGAEFSGGVSCLFAALPNCYDSGLQSYKVTVAAPVTITFPSGELTSLEVFFAGQDAATGQMIFFDSLVGGNQVDAPLSTNGSCPVVMPPRQMLEFSAPVKRIEVTASGGTAWIDTFMVNPVSTCGDGVLDFGEDCDDVGETATCDADCTTAECGDGTLNTTAGEECDDGNADPADGCNNECMLFVPIPTVSQWGVAVMLGLIMIFGTVAFRNRPAVQRT